LTWCKTNRIDWLYLGLKMVYMALGLMVIGILLIRKIIDIKV